MNNNNKSDYISLEEATKYCDYSQEYLSLRARQGKLKAVKIGRNWVTKKEWLKKYIDSFGESQIKGIEKPTRPKIIEPPENLPIETLTAKFSLIEEPVPRIRWGFATALIFVLLASGFFLFWQIQPKVSFGETATIVVTVDSKEVRASTIETFKGYTQWIKSKIPEIKNVYFIADDFAKKKFIRGYQIITRPFIKIHQLVFSPQEKPEIKDESEVLETTKEGIVVIPSTEEDEEIKRKIEESFSDEVRVEPKDKTSGIIIPIFREGEGQEYLYIMVPMEN